MIYANYIKPFLDRTFAMVMITLLFPLILSICLILLMTQGRHVFFAQLRTGKNMKTFRIIKFRTLNYLETSDLSMDNREFTFLGRIMRKTGADEIPQLFNILKGEMSFIGPRPMPVEYIDKYQKMHLDRFRVMPGVTGWAQVNGKNEISWGHRFDLDCQYVNNVSFTFDSKIIWLTVLQLFSFIINYKVVGKNMQVFNGSNLN